MSTLTARPKVQAHRIKLIIRSSSFPRLPGLGLMETRHLCLFHENEANLIRWFIRVHKGRTALIGLLRKEIRMERATFVERGGYVYYFADGWPHFLTADYKRCARLLTRLAANPMCVKGWIRQMVSVYPREDPAGWGRENIPCCLAEINLWGWLGGGEKHDHLFSQYILTSANGRSLSINVVV